MTVYIDADFKCHTEQAEGRRAFEVSFFDGKCAEYIEGYRFVPSGEQWTRSDGAVFKGEMIAPFTDHTGLERAQTAFERELLQQYEAAFSEIDAALGV